MIEVGSEAPEFTLLDQDENEVSLSDFRGRKVVLAFYPMDFCAGLLGPVLDLPGGSAGDRASAGWSWSASASTTPTRTRAFREKLGTEITLLADFHPKGEVARAYGA